MRKLICLFLALCTLLAAKPAGRIRQVQVDGAPDGSLTVEAEVARNVTAVQLEVADAQGRRILLRGGLQPQKGKLHFAERIAFPIQAWSAEHPVVYTLTVSAYTPRGLQELRVLPFTFRKLEWRRNHMLLNGRAVKPKGLRHTDLLPEGNPTEAEFLAAIRKLKQLNINAVSADYRPQDAAWAALCDRYGLYVAPPELLDSLAAPEADWALQHRYRDIRTAGTPWTLEVTNGFAFRDLSDVRLRWSLEADGEPVRTGTREYLLAGPGETLRLDLGVTPEQVAALQGTVTLTVRYELKRPWSLLPADTEIAHDQLLLQDRRPVLMDCEGPAVKLTEGPEGYVFSGAGWSLCFDRLTGALTTYNLVPDVPDASLRRFQVTQQEQGWWVEAVYGTGRLDWRISPDGSLHVEADLPLRFQLPAACDRLDYFGLGPQDLLGRYRQPVAGSGPHRGLRVFRVLDAAGTGLEVSAPLDFTAEARTYTPDGRLVTDVRLSAPEEATFIFVLKKL